MDSQELQRIKNRYGIVGNNINLNYALETALAVAPSDLAVLITGESGVGKDAISRIIHDNSRRKNAPYLAINCGAIPSGTINAELFGHEKGSFTGAVATRKGYFEEANNGTLFLDEIGELPKDTQALLLRVLQNGEFMKVGSSKIEKTNVRIICATNANLWHAVAEGKFREDLYYRLNAIQIKMPTLRERKDDIYLLYRKFVSDFTQQTGFAKVGLDHDAIAALQNYRWPGNIRQLKNFSEALVVIESSRYANSSSYANPDKITLSASELAQHLPREFDTLLPDTPKNPAGSGTGIDEDKIGPIIKAILDLKQEVDRLKRIVEQKDFSAPSLPPLPPNTENRPNAGVEEAEWQDSGQADSCQTSSTQTLAQTKDDLYKAALDKHNWKVKDAAQELGISERTLYRWVKIHK